MDQPQAPKPNPLPLIFVAVGGAGCLGALLIAAVLAWILWPSSKPKPAAGPATASTSTVLAAKETVVGETGSAQVTVPAGAVDKDVSFALTPQSKEPRSSPGVRVVGQVWSLRVDGHARFKFKKPVKIALPFERGLAKNGNAAALSWWDGRRWQEVAGSRVEGDRVVGEVDHFTDFGATEKDPETAPPPTWTDVGSWYGNVEISTYGHWSTDLGNHSTDWTVSRGASATFRLTSASLHGTTGKWSIPVNPSPEDQCMATARIADGGFRTDWDHDKSGNVYYYSHWLGGGGTSKPSASLEIDVAAGTYRFAISGKQMGKVDYTWSCSLGGERFGQSDAGFSFQTGPQPLPSALGSISGSVSDAEDKIKGGVGGGDIDTTPAPKNTIRTEVTWTLSPGPPGLKARIAGPRIVKRGDGIKLDGSTSTGEISEYLWTFDVESGGPKCPQEKVELRTPTVDFTALWNFKATLEVTDKSGKKDREVRHIQVTPRKGHDWELRFLENVPPKALTSALRAGSLDRASTLHLGINLCGKDGDVDYSGHYIHRKPARVQDVDMPTWVNVGYEVVRVGDQGPFGGLWFVRKQMLEIQRVELVNQNLMPLREVYVLNEEKRNLQDVLNLWDQIKEHEKQHTVLARKEFYKVRADKADPAAAIEKTIKPGKEELVEAADKAIMDIDSRIATAADEQKVKDELENNPRYRKDCSIWLYKEEGGVQTSVKRKLGRLSQIGDDFKDDGK